MSHTINSESVARIARRGFALAALLGLFFAGAAASRAQSSTGAPSAAAAKPRVASAAVPSAAAAKSAAGLDERATASANNSTSPTEKPATKGQHEGITVHGHWVIDVKDPDGTIASHHEFENSLVQPGGAEDLAFALTGAFVPGGYRVTLANGTSGLAGPCGVMSGAVTACFLEGSLVSPTPSSFSDGNTGCGNTNQISATGPCFPLTLTLTLVTNANGATVPAGFVLSGTAAPTSTTTPITDVFATPLFCPFPSGFGPFPLGAVTPSACAQGFVGAWFDLTHATLPSPVQITAVGQLVSVTVTISFQ